LRLRAARQIKRVRELGGFCHFFGVQRFFDNDHSSFSYRSIESQVGIDAKAQNIPAQIILQIVSHAACNAAKTEYIVPRCGRRMLQLEAVIFLPLFR
jgi:hypothetical protein